jgi:hypothetical protein
VWNIVNLLNLSKYRPKRLSIFSCCDAFLQIEYNYADDNTLSYGHPDFNVLTSVLESESNVVINWEGLSGLI